MSEIKSVWWVGGRGQRLHGYRKDETKTLCGIKLLSSHSGVPDFTQGHIECKRCLKVLGKNEVCPKCGAVLIRGMGDDPTGDDGVRCPNGCNIGE